MKIMIVNALHATIGGRVPDDRPSPWMQSLGLSAFVDPVIDAGPKAFLIEADRMKLSDADIPVQTAAQQTDAVFRRAKYLKVSRIACKSWGSKVWNSKLPVLTMKAPPLRLPLWAKRVDARIRMRLKIWLKTFSDSGAQSPHAMRWLAHMGRRIWSCGALNYIFPRRGAPDRTTLEVFGGAPQSGAAQLHPEVKAFIERSLARTKRAKRQSTKS